MEVFRESFAVRSYDVDAFGTLALPALAAYLQEVAGLHADALGCGMAELMRRGLTWVLFRQRLQVPLPIACGEVLEIASWPSGIDRLAALREFEVRRQNGDTAARATTEWLVMDLATRRPVRPDRVLDPRLREGAERALPPAPGSLPALATFESERRFEVRFQDIDRNLHVTNGSYAAFAVESVPRETWESCRPASLAAHYLAECRYGSAVLSRLSRAAEGDFLHAIVREEDGKELARLETGWLRRAET
jgi:acyl-ACP thioesterase